MYAVKEVSGEEWMFRGLAIATILALVEMAVLLAFQPVDWYFTLTYHPEGAGLAAASTAYESVVIIATAAALIT